MGRSLISIAALSLSILSLANGQNDTRPSLQNPLERFSRNFTLPEQEFPGLHRNWDPIAPDCGETSYVGSGRLQGRRALITGGDSGIGRAVAIAFAREGADVVINHLPEEQPDADEVISAIENSTDSRIFSIAGDIRNQTFCEDLVQESAELMGGLDILINNAGYSRVFRDITEHSLDDFHRTIDTNIKAPFYITRAAVPLLPPGSSIIFTSSLIQEMPPFDRADYAGSKAFIRTFAQALASGLMPELGIKVNVVRPALILTNFLTSQGVTQEMATANMGGLPMGRIQHPVEIAPQFVNMVIDDTAYTTGALH